MLAVLGMLIWLSAVNGYSCTDAEAGKGTRESRYQKGVNGVPGWEQIFRLHPKVSFRG